MGLQEPRAVYLRKVRLQHFRNISQIDWSPHSRFNVLVGNNGEGKTNLLEAIYYSLHLRSFRGATSEDMIQMGKESTNLIVDIASEPLDKQSRVILYRTKQREVLLDGKRPRSYRSFFHLLPLVLFHPADLALVAQPELRRNFIDNILTSADPTYENVLDTYQRALRSRNKLLKLGYSSAAISAYDEIMAQSGSIMGQSRASLIQILTPRIITLLKQILGEQFNGQIRYEQRVEPTPDALRKAFKENFEKDKLRGFTTRGPHVDDLFISLRERNARHQTSQGQQRSIVLSLKMAELSFLRDIKKTTPLLLLDDISSELDHIRNQILFEIIESIGGQVLITSTHPEYIRLQNDRKDWRVLEGSLQEL